MNMVGKLVINEETGNRGFILHPTNRIFAKNQLDEREKLPAEGVVQHWYSSHTSTKGADKPDRTETSKP